MALEEKNIKELIKEFLLEENLLKKPVEGPKIEFGFEFTFPPGSRSSIMAVIKPIDKNMIIISIGTEISKFYIEILADKKLNFYMELRKSFLLKNLYFRIDVQNDKYEISEQIFLDGYDCISKNSFFKCIRNVFNCAAYSNIILGEFVGDLDMSKDFSSDNDYTLYS